MDRVRAVTLAGLIFLLVGLVGGCLCNEEPKRQPPAGPVAPPPVQRAAPTPAVDPEPPRPSAQERAIREAVIALLEQHAGKIDTDKAKVRIGKKFKVTPEAVGEAFSKVSAHGFRSPSNRRSRARPDSMAPSSRCESSRQTG